MRYLLTSVILKLRWQEQKNKVDRNDEVLIASRCVCRTTCNWNNNTIGECDFECTVTVRGKYREEIATVCISS